MCSSFVSPHSGCKHFCCESDGTETEFLHAVRRFLDTNDRRRAGRPRSETRRSGQAGTLSQLVHSERSAPNIIGFNGLCCVSSTIVVREASAHDANSRAFDLARHYPKIVTTSVSL